MNTLVPSQQPADGKLKQKFESQAAAVEQVSASLAITTIISYFSNFALSQVWSAINILQITTLLGFIGAKIP